MFDIHFIRRATVNNGPGFCTLVLLSKCHLSCKECINRYFLKNENAKNTSLTPLELVNVCLNDLCYQLPTGGGVTLGGGEPLLFYKDFKEFRKLLPVPVKFNIETSLNIEPEIFKEVIDLIDYFIIDIKSINSEIYKNYTGMDNKFVLENLNLLVQKNIQDKCLIVLPININTKESLEESRLFLKQNNFNNVEEFNYIVGEEYESRIKGRN